MIILSLHPATSESCHASGTCARECSTPLKRYPLVNCDAGVQKSVACEWPLVTNQSINKESIVVELQLKTIVPGSTVIEGGVLSVTRKLAAVVSKLLQPSPAINITLIAALHVSESDGDAGE